MSGSVELVDRITLAKELTINNPINNGVIDRGKIKSQLRILKRQRKTLKGVEKSAILKLDNQIALLKGQLKSEKLGLPVFDINILSWVRENGYPVFATFNMERSKFNLDVRYRYLNQIIRKKKTVWSDPEISYFDIMFGYDCYSDLIGFPSKIKHIYKSAIEKNLPREASGESWKLELNTEFAGVIPASTKEKMHRIRKGKNGIFLIVAEVPKWNFC